MKSWTLIIWLFPLFKIFIFIAYCCENGCSNFFFMRERFIFDKMFPCIDIKFIFRSIKKSFIKFRKRNWEIFIIPICYTWINFFFPTIFEFFYLIINKRKYFLIFKYLDSWIYPVIIRNELGFLSHCVFNENFSQNFIKVLFSFL